MKYFFSLFFIIASFGFNVYGDEGSVCESKIQVPASGSNDLCLKYKDEKLQTCEKILLEEICKEKCYNKDGRCSLGTKDNKFTGYCICGDVRTSNRGGDFSKIDSLIMSTVAVIDEHESSNTTELKITTNGGISIYERNKLDCAEEIKFRPSKQPFLRFAKEADSNKLKAETVSSMPELYNLLVQLSHVKAFDKKKICFDFYRSQKDKIKISFGFKEAFTPAYATAYLNTAKQVGIIYKKIAESPDSKVENVNIVGFADQQHSYPKNYKEHRGQFEIITESMGSNFSAFPYDKVLELNLLKDYLALFDQTEEVFNSTPDKYMSTVRTNQLLALNRAIQMKRGHLAGYNSLVIPEMKFLGNGFSSCKNEISREPFFEDYTKDTSAGIGLVGLSKKAETCDRRRIVVSEADLTTYSKYSPTSKPNAWLVSEKGSQTDYVSYYGCCFVHGTPVGDRKIKSCDFATTKLMYFLNNYRDYAHSLVGNNKVYARLIDSKFLEEEKKFTIKYAALMPQVGLFNENTESIVQILASATGNELSKIEDLLRADRSDNYDSLIKLKPNHLSDGDLAKIIVRRGNKVRMYGIDPVVESSKWYFFYGKKKNTTLNKFKNDMSFFRQPMLFTDVGCKLKGKNRLTEGEVKNLLSNQITAGVDPQKVEGIIKAYKKQNPKGDTLEDSDKNSAIEVSKENCVYISPTIIFGNECPKGSTPDSPKSNSTPGKVGGNVFPDYHFNDPEQKMTEMTFDGDTIKGLNTALKSSMKLLPNLTTTDIVNTVNEWICKPDIKPSLEEDAKGDKEKTLDEQDDC